MLVVITDDFTGASEIGGVALDKGYRTIIETRRVSRSDAEVLVIASDMRSLDAESARAKSGLLTAQILDLRPELLFKKIDSVLRGNIGPELDAQMQVEKKPRALLVPANPSRRRMIVNGVYYLDGTPIAESDFARYYDFRSPTSRVVDILRARTACEVTSLSPAEPFAGDGVYIGDAQDTKDLRAWSERVGDDVVPAGAADFFAAVLESRRTARPQNESPAPTANGEGRKLFVCGSNFSASRIAVAHAPERDIQIVGMPNEIYFSSDPDPHLLEIWADDVCVALRSCPNVVVTAPQSPSEQSLKGHKISQAMAGVTRLVIADAAIDDLMIEGGATAQAVISLLGIETLYPVQSLAPGVTRMIADGYPDLHITMKPGSYRWPNVLWNSNGRGGRTGAYG